jgi:hypothetical protein
MRLLRSITQRGFSVGRAGWFTVLEPNPWFPASRQPRGSRSRKRLSAESMGVAAIATPANPPQFLPPIDDDRHVTRRSLIALAATTITTGLLWWICNPR